MPPTGQKYLFWYVCIFYNIAKVKKLPCRGGIAKLAFKRAYLARYHTFLFFHCVRVLSPFWYPLYLLLWSIFLVPTILLSLSSDHNKKGENIDNKVFILLIPRPSASSSMPPIATSGVGLTCNMEPSRAWKKRRRWKDVFLTAWKITSTLISFTSDVGPKTSHLVFSPLDTSTISFYKLVSSRSRIYLDLDI